MYSIFIETHRIVRIIAIHHAHTATLSDIFKWVTMVERFGEKKSSADDCSIMNMSRRKRQPAATMNHCK